jgi:hypothetical protein
MESYLLSLIALNRGFYVAQFRWFPSSSCFANVKVMRYLDNKMSGGSKPFRLILRSIRRGCLPSERSYAIFQMPGRINLMSLNVQIIAIRIAGSRGPGP